MTQSIYASTTDTYGYDYSGERVKETNSLATIYYPSKYYYTDGTTPTKQVMLPNGILVATIYGSGSSAVPYTVATDQLSGSSITAPATTNGGVDQVLDYYPFGGLRLNEENTSLNQGRKFTGQFNDPDTTLDYMNARYYGSASGRFLSEDPQFLNVSNDQLSDPQQLNAYSYAKNNPITLSDPTGVSPFDYISGFVTGSSLSLGGNTAAFLSSLNPFHADIAYAPANEADTLQSAKLSQGASNNDRTNGLTAGLGFGDKLSQLAGVLGLLAAPEAGEEDALSTLSSTANDANSGLSAESAYSKAGEHVATLHPDRYPGMSANDIAGIAQDTRTNADVSARIKGTDPSTNAPVNKQYYGNSNTGQVFVNTNIGSPTVFPNSNPSGYISRQISRDLTNYGSK